MTVSAVGNGTTLNQSFRWTVLPDSQPVAVAPPGDQQDVPGNQVALQVDAVDLAGNPLTYAATGLPDGLAIDATSGLISGTVAVDAIAATPYAVTVTATDGTTIASQTFQWSVVAGPPVSLAPPGDQHSGAGDTVALQLQATDPDGDALTYAAANLPAGLAIDPASGLIGGQFDPAAFGQTAAATVTADDGNGSVASQTFRWQVDAPTISATGSNVNAVVGDGVSTLVVATLANPVDPTGDPSTYAVTIAWGDGTTTAGAVGMADDGTLRVQASHAYQAVGTYPVATTVTYAGVASAAATATATVTAASLTAQGVHVETVVGDGRPVAVATFTDTDRDGNPDDFTAVIAWDDGVTSAGAIAGRDGDWVVTGSHAFATHGTYAPSVTIRDRYGDSTSVTADAKVGDVYEGALSTLSVVAFADADPHGTLADYSATIDWGDGSSPSTVPGVGGTITFTPGVGYVVHGTHRYAEAGTDTVKVTVRDAGGSTLDGQRDVIVADAPLSGSGETFVEDTGTPFRGEVGTFTDANPRATVGDYRATIAWGDGTTSTGTVTADPAIGGLFRITGDHTYATSQVGAPATGTGPSRSRSPSWTSPARRWRFSSPRARSACCSPAGSGRG